MKLAIHPFRLATIAAAFAVFTLVAFAMTPVAAQAPPLAQAVTGQACGHVDLTFTNNHGPAHTYVWTVKTSDGQSIDVPVPTGEKTVTVQLEEDSTGGSGWVSFGVTAGPESDYYLAFQTAAVDTDCEPEPDPSDPPVDPSDPPVDPSDPPVDPSDPPVDPSDPPVDPSDPPVDPTDPPPAGPPGADGQDGVDGVDGEDGEDGEDGQSVVIITRRTTDSGDLVKGGFQTPVRADLGGGGTALANTTEPAGMAWQGQLALILAALVSAGGGIWMWRRTRNHI